MFHPSHECSNEPSSSFSAITEASRVMSECACQVGTHDAGVVGGTNTVGDDIGAGPWGGGGKRM